MIYNDYELVSMAQEGNEDVINILYNKYLPIINKKSRSIYKYVQDKGLELEDVCQECVIAFINSINDFNQDRDDLFYSFTNLCMDRSLMTLVRNINRKKNKYLNDSIPIETLDNELDLVGVISDEELNPELKCWYYDDYIKLYNRIIDKLTYFEECVLVLKLKGFNSEEIAILLDKSIKSVSNAFYRIRVKVRDVYV